MLFENENLEYSFRMSRNRFRLEADLLAPAFRWVAEQGLEIRTEFANPWGICDLIGCSISPKRSAKRLVLSQRNAIGPPLRVQLLLSIPDITTRRSISLNDLAERYQPYLNKSNIKSEIDRLIRHKFVVTNQRGNLQKLNGWMPLHDRIIAVELKLNRISDVLNQARQNLQLTHESYIGLPSSHAEHLLSTKKDQLMDYGIGLLSINPKCCKELLPPSRKGGNEIDQVSQTHCTERFWRNHLINSAS